MLIFFPIPLKARRMLFRAGMRWVVIWQVEYLANQMENASVFAYFWWHSFQIQMVIIVHKQVSLVTLTLWFGTEVIHAFFSISTLGNLYTDTFTFPNPFQKNILIRLIRLNILEYFCSFYIRRTNISFPWWIAIIKTLVNEFSGAACTEHSARTKCALFDTNCN